MGQSTEGSESWFPQQAHTTPKNQTLPRSSHLIGIASEPINVVAHKLECKQLVQQALVPGHLSRCCVKNSDSSIPGFHLDYHSYI